MTLPSYVPQLFEPLTFEEFACVFGLTEEDIREIENNETFKYQIDQAIHAANKHPIEYWRAFYEIKNERCNSGFYHLFIKALSRTLTNLPQDALTGLCSKIQDWNNRVIREHGGPCFYHFVGWP